uniref:J domain-containing protein n=1 Tax=Caenorhabditis tropicalis TaxID=1561998 RepID=A0A1I7TKV3_9PELO
MDQQDWKLCIEKGKHILEANSEDFPIKINVYRFTCRCNREEGNIATAIEECNEVLKFDNSDVETLLQRAETYMADEEYDLAIADYEQILEWDSTNTDAQTGKDQAKRAKELIGKRDYYKILGVRRNANKREIIKAYRKMAQKWHPDNFKDEKEKKKLRRNSLISQLPKKF